MHQFKLLHSMLTEKQRHNLVRVVVAACLMAVLEALGIVAIFYFFSLFTESSSAQGLNKILLFLNLNIGLEHVLIVGLFVLALIGLKNAYALWNAWYQNHYISFVRHSLSTRLLLSILNQQYSYFLKKNSEVLKARFLTDVDRITDGYLRGFLGLVSELLVALAIITVLCSQNFTGTVMVMSVAGVLGVALHFVLKKIAGKSSHDYSAALHSRYFIGGSMMTGIKDVKAGCTEKFFYGLFSKASEAFSRVVILQSMVVYSPRLVLETIAFVAIVLSLAIVGAGGDGIQELLPILAIYAAAAYRMLPSINRIITSLQQIRFSEEPISAIHEMMSTSEASEFQSNLKNANSVEFEQTIAVTDMSYHYPEASSQALKNVSFTIMKNEFIGIAGSSGAGKSTLIDLLLALLHPTNGSLSVDGCPITDINARDWRRHIGYVPQNIFLLDDTLANNIAFGRGEHIDMDEVQRVAALAQIDQFVCTELPEGYETQVGENGVRLSGGQRQRIGIARALYGGVDIFLFDEATSALDNETERAVTKSILSLSGKVTIIVIAHRLPTIKHADKLLVLENGCLVSEGSYDHLMETSDVFKRISCDD